MDRIIIYLISCLTSAAIAIFAYRFHYFGSEHSEEDDQAEHPERDPCLVQVHPADTDAETDIDIIAIHGLDAKSPDTWEYRNNDSAQRPRPNWLKDKDMLPSIVGNARIFTCDWPAKQFESSGDAKLRIEEIGRTLVAHINQRLLKDNRKRPILFIASCFGGIILMSFLTDAVDDDRILTSTRGVIFLATPFNGTAFGRIAYWAKPALSVQAWLRVADSVHNINMLMMLRKGSGRSPSLPKSSTKFATNTIILPLPSMRLAR